LSLVRKQSIRLPALIAIAAAWAPISCTFLPEQHIKQPEFSTVYVIARGWHTDIALAAQDLDGPLAALKESFPGARYLTFGFGDRTYILSRQTTFADLVRAMFPGRGAMLVTALQAPLPEAFGGRNVIALRLPQPGFRRVATFVWEYFDKDLSSEARRIADGPYLGSAFYSSVGIYDAVHTCNTWTAEVLQAGGLPVSTIGVLLADQVMDQARRLAVRQIEAGSPANAASD
jgi:uncharacterized protein (TIGR02117 family)